MERVARGSAMAGTRHQTYEREVRDLRCFEFETKVVIDVHRICCPDCGVKPEKVDQLPSQAPHSRRLAKTKSDRSAIPGALDGYTAASATPASSAILRPANRCGSARTTPNTGIKHHFSLHAHLFVQT